MNNTLTRYDGKRKLTCNKRYVLIAVMAAMSFLTAGCGIYTFSGTSIQPDVHSITIYQVENNAQLVNPNLANSFTQELQDKFRRLTKLDMLTEEGGDLELRVIITGYEVTPTAITADEVASMNRLTITAQIQFVNNKYPEDNIERRSFAAYQDYDSNNSLDSVQDTLCSQILETLVEDIFNATVADWK